MTTSLYLLHLTKASLKKKLLVYFFTHPESSLYLRETAKILNIDPANLSRELRKLEKEGIFTSKKQGNLKYFSLNRGYTLYQELKSIVLKTTEPTHAQLEPSAHKSTAKKASVYVIAGPNGAGKTTFAKKFLPKYANCKEFVNADLIAGGIAPFSPETAALSAGKILLNKIDDFSSKGKDFGFETTLSGRAYVRTLKELKSNGYEIHLFFLWIPTLEMALARIQDRVKRGGHNIPEPVVKRRFYKGICHLFGLYQPLLDSWTLFDNSREEPHLVAMQNEGNLKVIDQDLFSKIKKISGDI